MMDLAVVLSNGENIEAGDISVNTYDALPEMMNEELTMRQYELRILKAYLTRYDDDVKKVAQVLDISPATIYRMLKE